MLAQQNAEKSESVILKYGLLKNGLTNDTNNRFAAVQVVERVIAFLLGLEGGRI